nr:MAG: matrix protein [Mononegavirales sp.]
MKKSLQHTLKMPYYIWQRASEDRETPGWGLFKRNLIPLRYVRTEQPPEYWPFRSYEPRRRNGEIKIERLSYSLTFYFMLDRPFRDLGEALYHGKFWEREFGGPGGYRIILKALALYCIKYIQNQTDLELEPHYYYGVVVNGEASFRHSYPDLELEPNYRVHISRSFHTPDHRGVVCVNARINKLDAAARPPDFFRLMEGRYPIDLQYAADMLGLRLKKTPDDLWYIDQIFREV